MTTRQVGRVVDRAQLRAWCRQLVPPLRFSDHKGSCGRIALIGGAFDGGSAASVATAAALRCGADLVYIMTEPAAKPFVHGLSVRPLLCKQALGTCLDVVAFCDALCITDGVFPDANHVAPGTDPITGSSAELLEVVRAAVQRASERRVPMVVGPATASLPSFAPLIDEFECAHPEWATYAARSFASDLAGGRRVTHGDGPLRTDIGFSYERTTGRAIVLDRGGDEFELELLPDGITRGDLGAVWSPAIDAVVHGTAACFAGWCSQPRCAQVPQAAAAAVALGVVAEAVAVHHRKTRAWLPGTQALDIVECLGPAVRNMTKPHR